MKELLFTFRGLKGSLFIHLDSKLSVFALLIAVSIFHSSISSAATLPKDSTKPKKPSTLNDTWYLNSSPESRHIIDTTIFGIQYYNPTQGEGMEYANAGNFGSAAFPVMFQTSKKIGFNNGYNQFDLYRYQKDSVKYYQVIRPYTELAMMIGLKNEQFFQGRFANQHKGIIYYGVDFTRIFSKGTYPNQHTNDNGFNLYGIFNSKNKHWNVQADLIFNSFKVEENGGVAFDVFDSTLFQKTLAPVRLNNAINNYRQIDFYLKGSYNVGKKYKQVINDSTQRDALMPLFKISYQFNVEKNKNKYRDFDPDSSYYGSFYSKDSVFNDLNYLKFGNAVMLEYKWRKLTSDTSYEDKNFSVSAEAGYEYYMMEQNTQKSRFDNLYVGGTVRNNSFSRSHVLYNASVKYFPYGYNQHDLIVNGYAGYDFQKWGIITAHADYQLNEVPYIYQNYQSDSVNWSYQLPKTRTLSLGAKYQNPKWGILAEAHYYNLYNLPVYPGSPSPFFNLTKSNFVVAHIANRNGIKGVHLDNDIWVTIPPKGSNITDYYALLYTKHSLYYEMRLFKKALWFATGFDLRVRYYNNPPSYDPFLGNFYPSTDREKIVPQFDWFLNLKIKTVRVFLKVDNILSGAGLKGYYSLNGYPAPDVSFKFGLRWRFFE